MYRNILQTIEDIEIWPVIGLVIFFIFFLVVVFRVMRTDKNFIDKMKHLPFDDSEKPGDEITNM